jgi:predicted amidohydrolase YtcJ
MAARLTAFVVVGIVAVTLIAGLIVGAQRDDSQGPVDLIVHNAAVYTAGTDAETAEAVAIRGNQILRVGSDREILRLQRPQTTMIDARGATVLPGFNDSHTHFVSGGLGIERVDLASASSIAEMQLRIRSWAEANPDSPWVLGRGWYYQPFPDSLPTRQMLDAAVADRPAQLIAYDGHTAWVNSRALELAGIRRQTPDPPNGVVVRDPRTGEPTGVLKEAAMSLVARLVPQTTSDERARALRAAIAEAHRNGVTSIQNADGNASELDVYADARRAGELDIRVYSALTVGGEPSDAALDELGQIKDRYLNDPVFRTGAVQIGLDGVIESRTAAMLDPYTGSDRAGTPNIAADDLNRLVRLLDARGWQVMTHATGDRAVRMALDAYAHAARSNPEPARGRRHRVEHIDTVDVADVPRFGALGVIASMQPFHGTPEPKHLEVWTRNIGPERAARGWAYGSIADAGGRLAFGTDWPVLPMSPLLAIHTAVTRSTPAGPPAGGWNATQRLTLEAAINAFTSDAAWASFDEQRKGTLAPGMLADIVVLTDDIFQADAASLARTGVAVTIFDGRVVYRRDRANTNE